MLQAATMHRRSARTRAPTWCTAATCGMRAPSTHATMPACATPTRDPSSSACCSTPRCVGTASALSASARVTRTRCSMTPSTRRLSDTGARRGRPPRARRCPSTPPSTAAGGGARPRCRVRGCGSRARTSRLVATPGMRAAPPVRPSTLEMLTTSRPPPRRCSSLTFPSAPLHPSEVVVSAQRGRASRSERSESARHARSGSRSPPHSGASQPR